VQYGYNGNSLTFRVTLASVLYRFTRWGKIST